MFKCIYIYIASSRMVTCPVIFSSYPVLCASAWMSDAEQTVVTFRAKSDWNWRVRNGSSITWRPWVASSIPANHPFYCTYRYHIKPIWDHTLIVSCTVPPLNNLLKPFLSTVFVQLNNFSLVACTSHQDFLPRWNRITNDDY